MRINVGVPPSVLADQHLIAEYSEVSMPLNIIKSNRRPNKEITKVMFYRNNHIDFFRDKLLYLANRKTVLVTEMLSRDFKVNFPSLDLEGMPPELLNGWEPTFADSQYVRQRIVARLEEKPEWYRFRSSPIGKINISTFTQTILNSPLYC